jgi:hypothetical protein
MFSFSKSLTKHERVKANEEYNIVRWQKKYLFAKTSERNATGEFGGGKTVWGPHYISVR